MYIPITTLGIIYRIGFPVTENITPTVVTKNTNIINLIVRNIKVITPEFKITYYI